MTSTETVTGEVTDIKTVADLDYYLIPKEPSDVMTRTDGYVVMLRTRDLTAVERLPLVPTDCYRSVVLEEVDFAIGDEITLDIQPLTYTQESDHHYAAAGTHYDLRDDVDEQAKEKLYPIPDNVAISRQFWEDGPSLILSRKQLQITGVLFAAFVVGGAPLGGIVAALIFLWFTAIKSSDAYEYALTAGDGR